MCIIGSGVGNGYYETLDILLRSLKLDHAKASKMDDITKTTVYKISNWIYWLLKGLGGLVCYLCRPQGQVKSSNEEKEGNRRSSLPPPDVNVFILEDGHHDDHDPESAAKAKATKVDIESATAKANKVYGDYQSGLTKERVEVLGWFKKLDLIHKGTVVVALVLGLYVGISNIKTGGDCLRRLSNSHCSALDRYALQYNLVYIPGAIMFATASFSLATMVCGLGTGAFLHGAHAMLLSRRLKMLRTASSKKDDRIIHFLGEDYLLMQKLFIRSSNSWGSALAVWIFFGGTSKISKPAPCPVYEITSFPPPFSPCFLYPRISLYFQRYRGLAPVR